MHDRPIPRHHGLAGWLVLSVAACIYFACAARVVAETSVPIRVPEGFEVTHYADDDLAHDIFSMTVDSLGRIVVSGPGYVRILIDSNDDGKADTYTQFADGPQTGAQGMYFLGRDLICTGDEGLIRYRDRDGNDKADGPPDVFLKLKTGGEHYAHSVQKGPDGWWYVIVGNFAEVSVAYANLPTTPIRKPRAGVLLRLKPDLSGGEIVADGFRNAYDFAFNSHGDIFTFDSDDERDVSLPWYRPTRVFQVTPASDAGWVSKSWRRPNYFADMPPAIAEFGRASPSGVACYQHRQFPARYDGALFALDWTFGRVLALPLEQRDGSWTSEPIEFMKGTGQFGFAPTDVEVGPDGSLYVCVGGRGTRGSVYRVTYKASDKDQPAETAVTAQSSNQEKLIACLNALQPQSSWSRARWLPLARELGREPFVRAVGDEALPPRRRMRAIEILTEFFGGLDERTLQASVAAKEPEVRARAAWSIGRTDAAVIDASTRLRFLTDREANVRRVALESMLGATFESDLHVIIDPLSRALADKHHVVRQAAANVTARLSPVLGEQITAAVKAGPQARVSAALGFLTRNDGLDTSALRLGLEILSTNHPQALRLEAARLMQLALGDVGPQPDRPAAFDGYAPRANLDRYERELDVYRIQLAKFYPTGDALLDRELSRLLAMLAPSNRKLLDRVLAEISEDSHPVDDIHQLAVAARIPVEHDSAQRQIVAKALVALEAKIEARKLNQDTNWNDRIGELYHALVSYDSLLPGAIVSQPGFGRPGHVLFMSELPKELLGAAVEAFVRNIEAADDYAWKTDVIFVIGESDDPKHRVLVRGQYDNVAVQSAVLIVLADRPEPGDRDKFVHGLDSSQLEVLFACVEALEKLPPGQDATEQCALVRLLRRLGKEKGELPLSEKIVKLLERNTGQAFGPIAEKENSDKQAPVVEAWTQWAKTKFPEETARLLGDTTPEADELKKMLAQVEWASGDPQRGKKIFEKQACAQCHGGRQALGPDLAGAAQRFSRDDLFVAITLPNRDVSPRYQTTLVQTEGGQTYSGLIIYHSADGVLLRNAAGQTFRIEQADIALRRTLSTSLMPTGLLNGLSPGDLADLYAFIAALSSETPQTEATGGSPSLSGRREDEGQ